MIRVLIRACAAYVALVGASAGAQTIITQWNFNSVPPDSSNSTGSTAPSLGAGTLTMFGGATFTIANGAGSSDPAAADNTGLNTSTYSTVNNAGSAERGVEFAVSTVNYTGISLAFDLRYSNTTSRFVQFSYSTNGSTFVDLGAPFEAVTGGDQWYNARSIDLSAISGVNNNPNFKFRFAPVFAPGQGIFLPATPGQIYGSGGTGGGTLRYDMITINGTALVSIPPSGVASAAPAAACSSGGTVTLFVSVNPGQNPPSASLSVTANLTQIGGSSSAALFDNATSGDLVAGDNIFTLTTPVTSATLGPKTISFTIADNLPRTATAQTTVNVVNCSADSASRVVISQIFGGGGLAGPPAAPYNSDYVELFNRSNQVVDLTGWSIQYASAGAAGGFDNPADLVPLAGIIRPGQYLLVQMSDAGTTGSPLPSPDFAGFGGMGNTSGRVALVRNSVLLGVLCTSPNIEDLVGYGGSALCFEGGSPTSFLANNTAALRKLSGNQDADQNFNDFDASAPNPRNRAVGGFLAGYAARSPAAVCTGSPVLLTIAVVPGAAPASTGIQVRANLTNLGGGSAVALNDSGAAGDVTAGDGIYSLAYTIPASVPQGIRSISFNVTDNQSRSDSSSLTLAVAQCTPANSRVVISQVFGGGGNGGAPFNADFIEIFNRSQATVDLTGWSVQYSDGASALGFTGANQVNLSGSILAGQYLLIQAQRPGSNAGGSPLPAPDFRAFVDSPTPTNGFGMDNEFGRVALVRSATPLGTDTARADIEDFLGYGPSTISFEGILPTARTGNTTVVLRKLAGCQDTNQNAIDFDVVEPLNLPRNSAGPFNLCLATNGRCCIGARCAITTQAACAVTAGAAGRVFTSGAATCNAAGVTNSPCCFADYNKVGGIGVQDIFDFLADWFSNNPNANVGGNGTTPGGVQAIFDFLAAWFAGGC